MVNICKCGLTESYYHVSFLFISFDHNGAQTQTHIVCVSNELLSTQVNEASLSCFHPVSTSDQPAVIEPNKLNLRGSDASPSLSV